MKFSVITIIAVLTLVAGCSSTAKNANLYVEPTESTDSVIFWGEDSPGKFFVKVHEKIFLCRIDGAFQNSFSFDKPTRVALGQRKISICYREGANDAEALIEANFDNIAEYQIKLGEHSYTKVNFTVIDKNTGLKLS